MEEQKIALIFLNLSSNHFSLNSSERWAGTTSCWTRREEWERRWNNVKAGNVWRNIKNTIKSNLSTRIAFFAFASVGKLLNTRNSVLLVTQPSMNFLTTSAECFSLLLEKKSQRYHHYFNSISREKVLVESVSTRMWCCAWIFIVHEILIKIHFCA